MLQHEVLDRTFQALSDPGRRSMVERLSMGEASVSELAEPLDMTLTAVVQHVKVLESCGLVTSSKRGRTRYCRLHLETLDGIEGWIRDRRQQWERRLDRLGQILEEDERLPDADERRRSADHRPDEQETER